MKKSIIFTVFATLLVSLFSVGCSDSTSNPVDSTPATKQGAYIVSYPVGAAVWVDGVNTGKVTPILIDTLSVGTHSVKLVLAKFTDVTISKAVVASKVDTISQNMSGTDYVVYGPIKVWVASDLDANHPSGISFANGLAYGISGANKALVDVYLRDGQTAPDTTQIWASVWTTSLTRNAWFLKTSETSLTMSGNVTAVDKTTWLTKLTLNNLTSFIVYDNDDRYSKVIVSATGKDATTGKQWVEFRWIYNKVNLSNSF